jgi:hypothetical protein
LEYITFPFSWRSLGLENSSEFSSISLLEEQSPATNKTLYVHFNGKVEQCIAVDVEDGDDDGNGEEIYTAYNEDDSALEDRAIIMKRSPKPKNPSRSNKSSSRNSDSSENRSIAMLPSTIVKYRKDAIELPEPAVKQDNGFYSPGLFQSPLLDSLLPSQSSSKILFDSDDEDVDMWWVPPSTSANHGHLTSVTYNVL